LNSNGNLSPFDHFYVVKKTLEMHSEHDVVSRLEKYRDMVSHNFHTDAFKQLVETLKVQRVIRSEGELKASPIKNGSIIAVGEEASVEGASIWITWGPEKAELLGGGESEDLDWFLREHGTIRVLWEPES